MTSGSKYRVVSWRLLRCSGLIWRLVDDEVDGTREGSASHFLARPALLQYPCYYPVVAGSAWLIRDPWPWMLMKILVAFIPVYGFLTEACGFLPGSRDPAWVGAMADVCIPLIESLSWSVMRRVSTPSYMLSGMLALSFAK
jgi:hypothetical protein